MTFSTFLMLEVREILNKLIDKRKSEVSQYVIINEISKFPSIRFLSALGKKIFLVYAIIEIREKRTEKVKYEQLKWDTLIECYLYRVSMAIRSKVSLDRNWVCTSSLTREWCSKRKPKQRGYLQKGRVILERGKMSYIIMFQGTWVYSQRESRQYTGETPKQKYAYAKENIHKQQCLAN